MRFYAARQRPRPIEAARCSPGHDLLYTSGSVSRLDSEPLPRITKLDFSWLSDLVPSKCPVSLVSHSQQGSHDQVCSGPSPQTGSRAEILEQIGRLESELRALKTLLEQLPE